MLPTSVFSKSMGVLADACLSSFIGDIQRLQDITAVGGWWMADFFVLPAF